MWAHPWLLRRRGKGRRGVDGPSHLRERFVHGAAVLGLREGEGLHEQALGRLRTVRRVDRRRVVRAQRGVDATL
jgi:hypothetical protein